MPVGKFGVIPFEEAAKHYDITDLANGYYQLTRRSDTPPILNLKVIASIEPSAQTGGNAQAVLQGLILKILKTEKIGDFWKRVFWLQEKPSEENKWPNTWALELWHDDTMDIDDFKIGDPVRCHVDIKGKLLTRKGTDQEFIINTLKCWRIEKIKLSEL